MRSTGWLAVTFFTLFLTVAEGRILFRFIDFGRQGYALRNCKWSKHVVFQCVAVRAPHQQAPHDGKLGNIPMYVMKINQKNLSFRSMSVLCWDLHGTRDCTCKSYTHESTACAGSSHSNNNQYAALLTAYSMLLGFELRNGAATHVCRLCMCSPEPEAAVCT